MAEVRKIGLKDQLWHDLRADLARIAPNLASDDRLICCLCGRLLPIEAFSLEHIIPQQALRDDPAIVKQIHALDRSGCTLLCNSPLKLKGTRVSQNGCNSWKGRHFDKALRAVFNKTALTAPATGNHIIVATMIAAFLALFMKYGYQVTLSQSGSLLRRQFFQPTAFLSDLPVMCQLVLMGQMPSADDTTLSLWDMPFTFNFDMAGRCSVGVRNYVVTLPISRDPRLPLATALQYSPDRFKLRPDFRAFFD